MFEQAKKPAFWMFKIGMAVMIFKIIFRFASGDGAGVAQALVGSGGAAIMLTALVYILALPFYAIKNSMSKK